MVVGSFTGCPGGVGVGSGSLAGGSGLVLVTLGLVLMALGKVLELSGVVLEVLGMVLEWSWYHDTTIGGGSGSPSMVLKVLGWFL
jgi:hypothetical protein